MKDASFVSREAPPAINSYVSNLMLTTKLLFQDKKFTVLPIPDTAPSQCNPHPSMNASMAVGVRAARITRTPCPIQRHVETMILTASMSPTCHPPSSIEVIEPITCTSNKAHTGNTG
jgi:hypothetical protein